MNYKQIWYPIAEVWRICNYDSEEYGQASGGFIAFVAITLRFALFIMESTTSYKIDFDVYWIIVFIIAIAAVFYPITVTIFYFPIAVFLSLLRFVYELLFYGVFKLGEENEKN